jgi:type II secretory pathway pseudopilin PulG
MKVRSGQTLVEVVVSMLLSCVMITAVFTVALSNKSSGLQADNRAQAATVSQSLLKVLANYVTADPGIQLNIIPGPNCSPAMNCSANQASWSLNGDSQAPGWALNQGRHNVTGFPGMPPSGTVYYDVSWSGGAGCLGGGQTNNGPTIPVPEYCQPNIQVTVNWTGP